MVGEGVLLVCLAHPSVEQVLVVGRRTCGHQHPKLKELLLPDFFHLEDVAAELCGYDACFFCAGVSSLGKSEAEYRHLTYDLTLHFAGTLAALNAQMVFEYISGALTDSSGNGKVMWARVKGETENALFRLPFQAAYALRPGFLKPVEGQRNVRSYYVAVMWAYPVLIRLFPSQGCALRELALAMLSCAQNGYSKQVLEIADIGTAAAEAK